VVAVASEADTSLPGVVLVVARDQPCWQGTSRTGDDSLDVVVTDMLPEMLLQDDIDGDASKLRLHSPSAPAYA
jgi:hypothetical protein